MPPVLVNVNDRIAVRDTRFNPQGAFRFPIESKLILLLEGASKKLRPVVGSRSGALKSIFLHELLKGRLLHFVCLFHGETSFV